MEINQTGGVSVRGIAWQVVRAWRTDGPYAEDLVDREALRAGLPARDRALLQALVFAVLRHRSVLDLWIDHLRNGKLEHSVRDLLRTGLAGALLLGHAPHAAVNETVSLAGRSRGLVNALMRRALREQAELEALRDEAPPSERYSLPDFLVDRWTRNFGAADMEKLAAWCGQPAPLTVRVNALKEGAEEAVAALPFAAALPAHPGFYALSELPREALLTGLCYAQDPSTALAPALLAPQPGSRVLDACAAPGGKTALLAQQMGNSGGITAADASEVRLRTLRDNMDRMGVTNVQTLTADWSEKAAPDTGLFDFILADVPCSNTGVLRRRVDVRWRLTAKWLEEIAVTQRKILRNLLPRLAAGGALVYSTCSIEPEENERLVQAVLAGLPGFRLETSAVRLPHRDGTDGAFAARIVR